MNASGHSLRELIRPDGIASVCCNDQEVLRRVFVTVRDRHWREIPPTHWECEVDECHHTATLTARHVSDAVGFEWKGALQVSEDFQHLKFQMTGRVLQDMEVCRLGLVVLHSVESVVGSQITAVGARDTQSLNVGRTIAPQPLVDGIPGAMTEPFCRLVVERSDFGKLELQFEGDLFEIEDQRNWGDASFKTYCTPLRSGFPRMLTAGTSIVQSVEMRFAPSINTHRVTGWGKSPWKQTGVFPRIGREWTPASISNVAWHQVHFDVKGPGRLQRLREFLSSLASTKAEIGVDILDGDPSEELLTILSNHREQIARLILYGSQTAPPSANFVESWQRQITAKGAGVDVPISTGTRGYFVDFNREVPRGASGSRIAFPLTATVHSDDAETIRDNAVTIRDMTETARDALGASEVSIAPLALYHPRPVAPGSFPGELIAPWLTATLMSAAFARVDSVTLSGDVIEALVAREPHASRLLSRLVACGQHETVPVSAGTPVGVHAAAIKVSASDRQLILVANLTAKTAQVSLSNSSGPQVKSITNALTAKSWECNASGTVDTPAFSVMWIE